MPRPNKPRGHLLLRKLAESEGFAVLSPKAAVLFLMLIPHFDNHGKMHADSHLIKGLVCPKVHYLTVDAIERALIQISEVTSIKYFRQNGSWYLQALNFEEHQSIRKDRRGADTLPNYTVDTSYEAISGKRRSTPGVVLEYSETKPLDGSWDDLVALTAPGQQGDR